MFKIDIFVILIYYITFVPNHIAVDVRAFACVSLGSCRFALFWGQLIDVSNSKESCYEKQFTDRTATLSSNILFSLALCSLLQNEPTH